MARKGVKQNKYTQEFINQVLYERESEGKSYRFLAKKYGIPKGTIITWEYRKRHNGTAIRRKRERQQ
jgi:transposase